MKGSALILQLKTNPETKRLLWYVFGSSKGGPARIKIISAIRDRPLNANEITKVVGLDYKAIQHHISVLEKNNLITRSGPRYGAIYFVSGLLEVNMEGFDEIFTKLEGDSKWK